MDIAANNIEQFLIQQVSDLLKEKNQCQIVGNNSRHIKAMVDKIQTISTKNHIGVISYEPSELVIKVRAGTLIKDIEKLLQANNQQLGTDFPDYGNSTIGGAVATGETGSGRPFLGAIRDQVLGLGIINGKGQHLNFGAQVMKNVAGYDVSRLLCGSLGQFALITDVTLKVMPKRENITVILPEQKEPLISINKLAAQALPISAIVIDQGKIIIRLSGSEAVTSHAQHALSATYYEVDKNYWPSIHNKSHPFFKTNDAIWQVRLAATQALNEYDNQSFIDWCGHQRYIKTDTLNLNETHSKKAFKNLNKNEIYDSDIKSTDTLYKSLKSAFDEHNIFN